MTTTKLVENAVIADFLLDDRLAVLVPKPRDYDGKIGGDDQPDADEAKVTLAVSAVSQGEFHRGTGILRVLVTAEIRYNALAEEASANALDILAELVEDRLQPSTTIEGVIGREAAFSSDVLRVLGILDSSPEPRSEEEMLRVRVVTRTFIAAQIAEVPALPDLNVSAAGSGFVIVTDSPMTLTIYVTGATPYDHNLILQAASTGSLLKVTLYSATGFPTLKFYNEYVSAPQLLFSFSASSGTASFRRFGTGWRRVA